MSVKQWIGAADSVAQITRVSFSAYTAGVTYKIICNNKVVSYVAALSTSADVLQGLVSAWNASAYPEVLEAIAEYDSVTPAVKLTSRVAGTPFTVTGASSGAPTATVTASQAASGPNDFNTAANWLGGVAPIANDDILIKDSTVSILYGLDQSSTAYATIKVEASFTGQIGLPATSTSGSGYAEYRQQYLKLKSAGTPTITIGAGDGQFGPLLRLDLNGCNATINVYGTQRSSVKRPLDIVNPGSSSRLTAYAGSMQVDATSAATFAAISLVRMAGSSTAPSLLVGANITVTALSSYGGEVENYGTLTAADVTEQAILDNHNAAATVSVSARATVRWNSSAGIGTKLNVYNCGVIDFSGDPAGKTIAAADLYQGGSILDPQGVIAWSSGVALIGCKLSEVTLDLGRGQTITV